MRHTCTHHRKKSDTKPKDFIFAQRHVQGVSLGVEAAAVHSSHGHVNLSPIQVLKINVMHHSSNVRGHDELNTLGLLTAAI